MGNVTSVTGYVRKEETVSVLKSNILQNTFVLNINHPFPGYYGQEMLDMTKPRSIMFITNQEESWEHIIRLNTKINKYLDLNVNLSKAKINLWNKTFHGKGFDDYSEIHNVQRALQDEGYSFKKSRKMKTVEVGLMTLKKFFSIEEVEEGIYMSPTRTDMAYIKIPFYINWELFRKHTLTVKNNISDSSYDIVSGAFYMNKEIVDILRIYKPGIKIELLREIKQRYEDVMNKFDHS